LHSQQHEPYHDFKQGKEGLDKEVSQSNSRIRNNGQHLIASSKHSQVG